MQPSIQKLFQAAKDIREIEAPSALARLLNVSQQTLKNWETRGISKVGALRAQATLGLDSNELLALNTPIQDEIETEPQAHIYTQTPTKALPTSTHVSPYTFAPWPFASITKAQWSRLSDAQRTAVEAIIQSFIPEQDQRAHQAQPENKSAAG